jgi:hypothetical protein
VVGAAVVIVAVTVTAVPLSCTAELDKLHVGAGVADGVMLQLRFTVPVGWFLKSRTGCLHPRG